MQFCKLEFLELHLRIFRRNSIKSTNLVSGYSFNEISPTEMETIRAVSGVS